jgi:hypothetical protein
MQNLEKNEVAQNIQSNLNTVTPLSKYLAMALFVALPFLAGWIGYTYAPEKIVEIEKIIVKEQISHSVNPNYDTIENYCDRNISNIPKDAIPVVPNSQYLKSSTSVYLKRVDESRLVPNAHPENFRVLPDIDEFGMDDNRVFYAGCELPNANPETFKHLPNGTYGTDGTYVYWRWKMLVFVDAKTFTALPRGYGKDDKFVYWEDEIIPGADPKTFESFEDKDGITARDKNHTYLLNNIVQ